MASRAGYWSAWIDFMLEIGAPSWAVPFAFGLALPCLITAQSLTNAFERPHAECRGSRIRNSLLLIGDLNARITQIWGVDPTLQDTDV